MPKISNLEKKKRHWVKTDNGIHSIGTIIIFSCLQDKIRESFKTVENIFASNFSLSFSLDKVLLC